MHITMNNVELKEAVELWLANEGLTPNKYDIEVKFVAGRNGNEGRIEINAQKKINDILSDEPIPVEPEKGVEVDKDNPFGDEDEVTTKKTVGDLFKA